MLKEIEFCGSMLTSVSCPAEHDSHCTLGFNVDTISDSVPANCPLRKSPITLQLKDDILVTLAEA